MKAKKPIKRVKQTIDGYSFPDISSITDKVALIKAMNYANYVFEPKDLKEFAKIFMGISLQFVPDYEFRHLGVMCWLYNSGYMDSPENITNLKEKILDLVERYKKTAPDLVSKTPAKTSKSEQTILLLSEFEKYIDLVMTNKPVFALQDSIQRLQNVDKEVINKWYSLQIEELSDAENKKFYPSTDYRKRCLNGVIAIKEAFEEGSLKFIKKTKAIKRPSKTKSPTMLVKKLKYLKEFAELSLKSIPPEKIIGSTSLWVYNTKTRKLSNFVSEVGLTVKGTSIYNYIPEKSYMKTLRTPQKQLSELMNCNKVEQRKFMDTLTTTAYLLNGRLTNDTIILKVF